MLRLLLVLLVLTFCAHEAQAQELPERYEEEVEVDTTRQARLRAARELKEERYLEYRKPGFLERAASYVEVQTNLLDFPDIELLSVPGLRPIFGGLRTGAGYTAGLRYQPTTSHSPALFRVQGAYSLQGYYGAETVLGWDAGPLVTHGFGRFWHMPQEDFFGTGFNTDEADRSDYAHDELIAGGVLAWRAAETFYLGGLGAYEMNRLAEGTDEDEPDLRVQFDREPEADPVEGESDLGGAIRGIVRTPDGLDFVDVDYGMFGGFAELDTRDVGFEDRYLRRFTPAESRLQGLSLDATRGIYLSGRVTRHQALDGRDYSFTRFEGESQQFLPIRGGFQVLALRQLASFSEPDGGEEVPFYKMQTLGGPRTLRGYDTFRFRDENLLLLNAEFRYWVMTQLNMAIFLDAGQVFQEFGSLALKEVDYSYGVGFRYRPSGRTVGRIDIAYGPEGVELYLSLGSVL